MRKYYIYITKLYKHQQNTVTTLTSLIKSIKKSLQRDANNRKLNKKHQNRIKVTANIMKIIMESIIRMMEIHCKYYDNQRMRKKTQRDFIKM